MSTTNFPSSTSKISLSHTHTLSLSLSLSLTHTHTLLSRARILYLSLAHSFSLFLSRALFLLFSLPYLSLTLPNPLASTVSLLSLSLSLSLVPTLRSPCSLCPPPPPSPPLAFVSFWSARLYSRRTSNFKFFFYSLWPFHANVRAQPKFGPCGRGGPPLFQAAGMPMLIGLFCSLIGLFLGLF